MPGETRRAFDRTNQLSACPLRPSSRPGRGVL